MRKIYSESAIMLIGFETIIIGFRNIYIGDGCSDGGVEY
jgi:hypothetical protein